MWSRGRSALVGLVLIFGAGGLYACAVPPPAPQPGAEQEGSSVADVTPAGQFEAEGLTVSWAPEGNDLTFQIGVVKPNSCYGAGPVSQVLEADGVLAVQADITYAGGICAQALKTVQFDGVAPDAARFKAIRLTVNDARTGRSDVTLIEP